MNRKEISVIIPNYNYSRYLKERVNSILQQTYPVSEIIILDDASTDNSLEVINEIINQNPEIPITLVSNEENSGSVFKQWFKGMKLATKEYIWMAEADDLSAPTFVEKVMAGFELDQDVILSYCQSKKIDTYGVVFEEACLAHTNEIDPMKWTKSYLRQGIDEICDSLIVKCTIPNVSSSIFRNVVVSSITEEASAYKLAGDWRFYIWLLEKGKIYFESEPLNFHRFHTNSVRESVNKKLDYEEFLKVQDVVLNRFEIDEPVKEKVSQLRDNIQKNIEALENGSYDTHLRKLLNRIDGYERLAIYGSGQAAKLLIDFLSKEGLETRTYINCIVEEMNAEKIGKDVLGVPIVTLSDAKSTYRTDGIIIASNLYQETIYERIKYLEDEGIRIFKVIE